MAPNIFDLFFDASRHHQETNLHYQHRPVPGIYLTDASNHRFLIAVKSNGKRDIHHILKKIQSSMTKEHLHSYRGCTWSSSNTTLNNSIRSGASTPTLNAGFKSPTAKQHNIETTDTTAVSWRTSHVPYNTCSQNKHDCKPLAIEKLARHFLPAPIINKIFKKTSHLTLEDNYGGYLNLAKPLEIKYCNILERWMFVSEIVARTKIVYMCGFEKCLAKHHTDDNFVSLSVFPKKLNGQWLTISQRRLTCRTMVERSVFMLDDGTTYIIVGDVRDSRAYGKEIYRRKGATMWNSAFFYKTVYGEMVRMRPNEWCSKRRQLFALNEREKRIFTEVDDLYANVVEYIN
jgi:hypothetical protein